MKKTSKIIVKPIKKLTANQCDDFKIVIGDSEILALVCTSAGEFSRIRSN